MTTSPILEVNQLRKNYGRLAAVDGVSFSVPEGICFGLLGPNGAGKTTTIEIIEGITPATAGTIRYRGRPRDAAFNNEIGIQFQHTSLLSFLTVTETLETFSALYADTESIDTLIERCHLEGIRSNYNDRISGGQRQRLLLALALLNKPRLLFLDEPSTGLDPQARRDLWEIVRQIKGEGKTIILTTHYMEEAEYLCDNIAIMDGGRIIAEGSPEALITRYQKGMTVSLPRDNFRNGLEELGLPVREARDRIEIQTEDVDACLQTLLTRDVDLTDMMIRSPNLEDVFIHLTGRQLRD
jgi:ABC-2 type transport system ATP-binding protein